MKSAQNISNCHLKKSETIGLDNISPLFNYLGESIPIQGIFANFFMGYENWLYLIYTYVEKYGQVYRTHASLNVNTGSMEAKMLLGLGCMMAAVLFKNIYKVECAQKSGGVQRHNCFWGCTQA